jgi:2'-5' RNA ligase
MVEPNRLFFALWPDESVRSACQRAAREILAKTQREGRLTSPESYHLTLLFLGHAVPTEQETAARQAAKAVQASAFRLTLDVASSFPHSAAWWLGTREPPQALLALRLSLDEQMLNFGVVGDRANFTPHLTVIRARGRLASTPVRPIEWPVSDFVLMRSRLDAQPSVYDVLERWPLRKSATSREPQSQP